MKAVLEEKYHAAAEELAVYLTESFGNSTRIDYGTGSYLILSQREQQILYIFQSFFLMQGLSSGLLVATKVDVQPF